MRMPYNRWFYEQYNYLTGMKNGKIEPTDTKWVTINNRLKILNDINSPLLEEQPFGVIGNERGFEHLLDLMGRSNYTFEDVNDAMIDTYKYSLKNAMGRNMVNTQVVMFKTEQMDFNNVVNEEFTHYYIVDAPFNQLHFGGRDAFIRQQIIKMYERGTKSWMSVQEFTKTFNENIRHEPKNIKMGAVELLPFTIIATINGFMCNDFYVALSDQGLKFKVGWPYSADAKFIVYKLDIADVLTCETDIQCIESHLVPWEDFDQRKNVPDMQHTSCLVNIYDKNFIKTSPSVPNFGWFDEKGLRLSNVQKRTSIELERKQSEKLTIVVYILKFFQEVQGIFPAINYHQLTDNRSVYDYEGNNVTDVKGRRIFSNSTNNNWLEPCTPPICLDRENDKSFTILSQALQLEHRLKLLKPIMINIGRRLGEYLDEDSFLNYVLNPLLEYTQEEGLLKQLTDCFNVYQKTAIVTSLIPVTMIDRFKKFLNQIRELSELTAEQYEEATIYNLDEFHGDTWDWFVDDIIKPITNDVLKPFININSLATDYFREIDTNHLRFNRPVSENCLICLRWDPIEDAWLFHLPEIKRFKGIGNTFYINDDLQGNEIFKFFVLYSDMENPKDTHVETLTDKQAFDFDEFIQQLERYDGYIRYWHAENRLMKMSYILYNRYDDITITNTLSRILKGVIDGNDLLDVDVSNLNYEASGITSSNWDGYDVMSEQAPFVLNYLFYTLANLQENEDKLHAYFYHQLVMKRFHKRYFDMFIDTTEELTYPFNYSKFNKIKPLFLNIDGYVIGEEKDGTTGMYIDPTVGYLDPEKEFVVNRTGPGPFDNQMTIAASDKKDTEVLSLISIPPASVTVLQQSEIDDYWSNANLFMTKFSDEQFDYFVGDNYLTAYYGIPQIYKNNNVFAEGHPYVFNVYHSEQKHFMVTMNDLHLERHKIPESDTIKTISFENDIALARRFTFYLTYLYNAFADIQTNFVKSYNLQSTIDTHIETIEREIQLLSSFVEKEFHKSNSLTVLNMIVNDNPFLIKVKKIKKLMRDIMMVKKNKSRNFVSFINQIITDIRVIHKNYGFDDIVTKRIRNLYNHLTLINDRRMTCTQFKDWLNNVDTHLLGNIDTMFAENENHEVTELLFYDQNEIFEDHRKRVIPLLSELEMLMVDLVSELESHIKPIIDETIRIVDSNIFDLYVLDSLPSFRDLTFSAGPYESHAPYYICAVIESKSHINMLDHTDNESSNLIFQPILDKINGAFYIKGLTKICEYTFFSGETINAEVFVYTRNGKILYNTFQELTFRKIGSTADNIVDFNLLVNIKQMYAEFQNVHQNLTINSNNDVVNEHHSELNFELLHSNRLLQLYHSTQHSTDKDRMNIYDRVEVPNHILNEFVNMEYSKRLQYGVFFKPIQIVIPFDKLNQPIGSRYFVGQRIFLKSKDNKCLFPATVTAIDHHINKGFIEAAVSPRSKWFEMTEMKDIERYFYELIDCEILEDNISNFLDEYTNSDYWTFSNANWNPYIRRYDDGSLVENTVTIPGDPIYVQNNTPFVYTRLAWMFNELVQNSFIDDDHKQQRFIYAGKFDSHNAEEITIKIIKHDFDNITLPEKYPVLRTEPNDHSVWDDETLLFTELMEESQEKADDLYRHICRLQEKLDTNLQKKVRLLVEIEMDKYKIDYIQQIEERDRMKSYLDHLEPPTDWHNVRAYEDALVYIQNGRAHLSHTFLPSIKDIPYNKNMNVFIFDWENKTWLNPNHYNVELRWEDDVRINQHADYMTKHILHRIVIRPKTGFKDSKSLLVYFSYRKSDVFNEVEKAYTNECKVRFKPIISLPDRNEVFEPYQNFSIRKHVSTQENYIFREEDN